MDIDMAAKSSGSSEKESPDTSRKGNSRQLGRMGVKSKNPSESKLPYDSNAKPNTHSYHGSNHRQHKKQQKHIAQNCNNNPGLAYDLDFSIQEELSNGNYKFRGGKAQVSINHLLQFQLPEIERNGSGDNRDVVRRKNKTNNAIHLVGDSFINANYRLLVDDRYDYKEQSNDPNVPVPPENIIRVVVPRCQQCPICLEEPVAPRMVTCGHIFCHSCLINFFAVEDATKDNSNVYVKKKKLKECPLCGSIIRPNKVKSVLFENDPLDSEPLPNAKIRMVLMCKPHGSVLPLPVHLGIDPSRTGNFPSAEFDLLSVYAHIMKCNSKRAIEMLQRDVEDINTQNEIDKILYNDNGEFSHLAVEETENKIKAISEQEKHETDITQAMSNIDLGTNLKDKYNDNSAFFFFQTAFQSSTKYFLSPLDVKILLTAFHRYSSFPEELSMTVENVHSCITVTEELLARYKYFNHLPLGSEIAFVDLDWRDNAIVPKEVEQQFNGELKQRRRKLRLKKQREDKEKINYQNRIEKEQKEFYSRENGEPSSVPAPLEYSSDQISLDSLSAAKQYEAVSIEESRSRKGYVERTIWGTSISHSQDNKTSKENQEFESMLLQKMQESEDSDSKVPGKKGKKNRKSKAKVMLFSNTHQTF